METCEFCKRKAGISTTGDTCGAEEYRSIGAGHMLPQVVLDDCLIATLTRERDAAIAEAAGLREMIGHAEKEHHRATKSYADLARDAAGLRARLDAATTRRPESEWHEDIGPVLWWNDPISEPAYCGTPLDDDFPDYMTRWTPLLVPAERSSREGAEAKA